MRFRFQFRRYRLPFRAAVRTAHGLWSEREGVLVRIEKHGDKAHEDGRSVVFGEAAPIPWFGTETVDEVEEACRSLGEFVEAEALNTVPARLGCLHSALQSARLELTDPGEGKRLGAPNALGVAALLPAGRGVLEQIAPKADAGFRVFKWKVGVGDIADELALLDDVCAALPAGAMLRLDANGAWDRRKAERWLERCADRPVEFVEQPCFAEATQGNTRQRRSDDILLGLAGDYPTPIALDESLVGDGDVVRWIEAGWPGIFVVKPSLMGDVEGALHRLARAKARVVFSSALETAVGARAALRIAFRWQDMKPVQAEDSGSRPETAKPFALGFGVWPLFADARFDGPAAAPFIRWEDVERINAEAIWNALP